MVRIDGVQEGGRVGGVVRENDPDDEAFSEVSLFNAALEMMCKR